MRVLDNRPWEIPGLGLRLTGANDMLKNGNRKYSHLPTALGVVEVAGRLKVIRHSRAILEFLRTSSPHPTAGRAWEAVHERSSHISLSAVCCNPWGQCVGLCLELGPSTRTRDAVWKPTHSAPVAGQEVPEDIEDWVEKCLA